MPLYEPQKGLGLVRTARRGWRLTASLAAFVLAATDVSTEPIEAVDRRSPAGSRRQLACLGTQPLDDAARRRGVVLGDVIADLLQIRPGALGGR
jgi:hypothetical protein